MRFHVTAEHLHTFILLTILVVAGGCGGPERLDDYNDRTFELVDQNGESVNFPDDLLGKPVLMGFIYTHCPDICSFVTANLQKVWEELDRPEDIHFVTVTFDPLRDTPEVLKSYANAFEMNRAPFLFLTGSETEIGELMQRVGVRSQISYTTETDDGEFYFLNHSDKILLIDAYGRLVMDYGGSMTPVTIFVEDLNKLL